jgi:hypothetical protein
MPVPFAWRMRKRSGGAELARMRRRGRYVIVFSLP